MQLRQAALGGLLAAALIIGGGATPVPQAGGRAFAVGTIAPPSRPEVVFDGLRHWRDAGLDVVFDVVGALIAQAKQF